MIADSRARLHIWMSEIGEDKHCVAMEIIIQKIQNLNIPFFFTFPPLSASLALFVSLILKRQLAKTI